MTDTNEVEREGISREGIEREEFLAIRKDWASKIDPETAEMLWKYGSVLDPYGIYPPFEEENIERNHFARAPGSDVWVHFGDLPAVTEAILRKNRPDPKTDPLWISAKRARTNPEEVG